MYPKHPSDRWHHLRLEFITNFIVDSLKSPLAHIVIAELGESLLKFQQVSINECRLPIHSSSFGMHKKCEGKLLISKMQAIHHIIGATVTSGCDWVFSCSLM